MYIERRQRGLTLVELIVFILIVGVALAGILTVMNVTVKSSADPLIRKQMLAIAEALMEEVQMQPFTWCDPRDTQADTALSNSVGATGCSFGARVELPGPEYTVGTLSRMNIAYPFNNVNDYSTLAGGAISGNLHGLGDVGNPVKSLSGGQLSPTPSGGRYYAATIQTTQSQVKSDVPLSASILIRVTVAYAGESITLEGYRTRHSPNYTQ